MGFLDNILCYQFFSINTDRQFQKKNNGSSWIAIKCWKTSNIFSACTFAVKWCSVNFVNDSNRFSTKLTRWPFTKFNIIRPPENLNNIHIYNFIISIKTQKDCNFPVTVSYKNTSVPSRKVTTICPASEILMWSRSWFMITPSN